MNIVVTINTDNAAFYREDHDTLDPLPEVQRILEEVCASAKNIEAVLTGDVVTILDVNGNKVGAMFATTAPPGGSDE